MNAIFISRIGERIIKWDQATLNHVLVQLRQERELSDFIRLLVRSLAHVITLIEQCSHDPEQESRYRRWLLVALCACAGEVVHPEAEPDISHANDST
jgi:hypothetical protein